VPVFGIGAKGEYVPILSGAIVVSVGAASIADWGGLHGVGGGKITGIHGGGGITSQIGCGIQHDIAQTGITGTGITCSQFIVLYRANLELNFDIPIYT
jgi:hypothetical protein